MCAMSFVTGPTVIKQNPDKRLVIEELYSSVCAKTMDKVYIDGPCGVCCMVGF